MLQNRVDPFGNIIKTAAHGTFMGNRGLLHNTQQVIIRPYKLKAWITCRLEFKGWKRTVMMPGKYTELFFMDEVTSFAAGHRPCFECRRADALRFKNAWINGNPEYGFNIKTSMNAIDGILHNERIGNRGEQITFEEDPAQLPDGTFIVLDAEPWLIWNRLLYYWTASGYSKSIPLPLGQYVKVLTPKSVVHAFRAGYIPQMSIPENL